MFNKVIIAGNLTRDPEVKQAGSSTVASICVAMNEKYKKNDELVEKTVFVDVDIWGSQADNVAKYLKKGSKVLVDGKLKLETWVDKESGKNRSKLGVTGLSVQFLDSKGDSSKGGDTGKSETQVNSGAGDFDEDDDIPF